MYNVKVYTYPDLSKQVKLYKVPVKMGYDEPDKKKCEKKCVEYDVFNNLRVRDFKTDDDLKDLDRSLQVSANRSKNKIYQYAKSNEWEWFTTFTFDKEKVDRCDYSACVKLLSKWLNNMRKHSKNLAYLIVPEQHKKGGYHFHGLFSGCDGLNIKDTGKTYVQKYIVNGKKRFRKTKDKIYIFDRYKFGYMTASKVKDNDRVTKYITKYVTKDLMESTFGKKRYWASRNLLLPVEDTDMLSELDIFELKNGMLDIADYHKQIDVRQYGEQVIDIFELK